MKTSFYCKGLVLCFFLFFGGLNVFGQLIVSTASTPTQLVQNILVQGGLSVSNITFTGATGTNGQIGSFTNGNTTNLGLTSGVLLSTNDVSLIPGPVSNFMDNYLLHAGDEDLESKFN